jgi:carbon storage regulator
MLVIGRKAGESILIGPDVEIHVIEVAGSRVKIGIRAPRHLNILRKEIQLAAEQNQAAAQGFPTEPAAITSLVEKLRR